MENKLRYFKEFQEILENYHITEAGQKTLTESRLALLVGPTASGRDTIIRKLLTTGDYYHLVSDTTRKPRINNGLLEQNGVEYQFRTEKEFLADLKSGKLLEAEIIHGQQVSGISIRELKKAHGQNKIGITNVDLNIETIIKAKPDTIAFFVLPPSFEEWMRRRTQRDNLPQEEKHRRIETALKIFEAGLEHSYYNFVINDKVDNAVEAIYIRSVLGFTDLINQIRGRRLCEQLYLETKKYLAGKNTS
jgi:guanylate kinase